MHRATTPQALNWLISFSFPLYFASCELDTFQTLLPLSLVALIALSAIHHLSGLPSGFPSFLPTFVCSSLPGPRSWNRNSTLPEFPICFEQSMNLYSVATRKHVPRCRTTQASQRQQRGGAPMAQRDACSSCRNAPDGGGGFVLKPVQLLAHSLRSSSHGKACVLKVCW